MHDARKQEGPPKVQKGKWDFRALARLSSWLNPGRFCLILPDECRKFSKPNHLSFD
jgi:hypothetical protein